MALNRNFWALRKHVIVSVVLLTNSSPVSGAPPAAEYSSPQLRAKILEAQNRITDFHAVYRIDRKSPNPALAGHYIHRDVNLKAPHFASYLIAHGSPEADWRDDPFAHEVHSREESCYIVVPLSREYSVQTIGPKDPLPDNPDPGLLISATGIWPLERPSPRFNDRSLALREVAASDDYATVRPLQELIDGCWCHVLENSGTDLMWIDARRGYALVARELFDPDGTRAIRFEMGDFRELKPDVWIPHRVRGTRYNDRAADPVERQRALKETSIQILELSVSEIDGRTFDYKPPPGAMEKRDGILVQTRPGGIELLDEMAAWSERFFSRDLTAGYGVYYPIVAAALLMIGGEAWLRWRSRGQHDPKPRE